LQYRDYVYVSNSHSIIKALLRLFENDWQFSVSLNQPFPTFNPIPPICQESLIVSPTGASSKLISFIQKAKKTLDITSELLGNPTLESELFAAVLKGVRVELISPEIVNGATPQDQALQLTSLTALKAASIDVHVTTLPESTEFPYIHLRTIIADKKIDYIGSISFSRDSITF